MMVLQASNGDIYPADRCRWRIEADGDYGYRVVAAAVNAGGPAFTTGNAGYVLIPGGDTAATRVRFGYIGKSGRFVPETNA